MKIGFAGSAKRGLQRATIPGDICVSKVKEWGVINTSVSQLYSIAGALNVPVAELFNFEVSLTK